MSVFTPTVPTFSTPVTLGLFTSVAAPGATVQLDLTTKIGATLLVRFGRTVTTALTRSAVVAIRRTANNNVQFPASAYDAISSIGAVSATTIVSGGGAGSTAIVLASGAGFAAQQSCCAQLAGARIEFFGLSDLTTATITLDRSTGLRIAHNAADAVTNGADCFPIDLPGGDIWEITPVNNSGQSLIIGVDALVYPSYTGV